MLQVLWVRHPWLSVMRCYEGLHGAILGKSCQNVDKHEEEVVLNFFRGSLTAHSRHHCLLYLDNRGEGDDPRATIWGSEINPLSFTRDDKARYPGSSLGMNRGTAFSPHMSTLPWVMCLACLGHMHIRVTRFVQEVSPFLGEEPTSSTNLDEWNKWNFMKSFFLNLEIDFLYVFMQWIIAVDMIFGGAGLPAIWGRTACLLGINPKKRVRAGRDEAFCLPPQTTAFLIFWFVIDIDSCTWVIPQMYVLHLLYVVCSGVRHSSCESFVGKGWKRVDHVLLHPMVVDALNLCSNQR